MWLRLLTFYFRSPKGFQKIFQSSSLGRLRKKTGPDLCLLIYIKSLVFVFISFLIIKARLKKYFSPSFPKKFLNKPLNTDFNVGKLFLSNHSPKNSGVFP